MADTFVPIALNRHERRKHARLGSASPYRLCRCGGYQPRERVSCACSVLR
jgi:hypothetical protein